ncbi:MAG: CDP-alcohol phosphatidyltransferase family protein [Rhizobiales bacterium]|nr:CDP-alcohol phosphatidyltransferase family protein [Hyphomicrobiales bacterium]
MISIYDLKPKFQNLLRPICQKLADGGVTANQVTIFALLVSVLHGIGLAVWPGQTFLLLLLPATLFIRMALNAIDGMLAREHGQKSRLGAILNELSDVIADIALYLPFALIAGLSAPLVTIVVLLAVIVEMTGILGLMVGAERRYDGPFGKSDRAFVFGTLAVAITTGFVGPTLASVLLVVIIALSCLTIFNRARMALSAGASQ